MASLYKACKDAVMNKQGGTYNIGGYDIDIEMYSQQDIDNDIQFENVSFGDTDESKIVLVVDDIITIPEGYTLTPESPKKSLVIFCNTLINNGTISMYQKAPDTLPHDYYIIEGSTINSNKNIIIPAYANNRVERQRKTGVSGNDGTNRNCGSGGCGGADGVESTNLQRNNYIGASGSGYAFGGGAGSGGSFWYYEGFNSPDVDTIYPMRGGDGADHNTWNYNEGGVGNPIGKTYYMNGADKTSTHGNNFGCGGRIIIFCSSFENNGTITVDGTKSRKLSSTNPNPWTAGGASGAGAVDLFYKNMITEGTITANGGANYTYKGRNENTLYPGKGGDGSITLTQWSFDKIIREKRKMFTKDNWSYLFTNYSQRLREDVI